MLEIPLFSAIPPPIYGLSEPVLKLPPIYALNNAIFLIYKERII